MASNQQNAKNEAQKAIKTYDTMLAVIDILKNMVNDHKGHAQKFLKSVEGQLEQNVEQKSK